MGNQATVIVLLDGLSNISNDPNFGKNLADAIIKNHHTGERVDVSSGNFANPVSVVETHHADMTYVIAAGGNYGSVIGKTLGWKHSDQEDVERILRQVAEQHGFELRKKAKQTTNEKK